MKVYANADEWYPVYTLSLVNDYRDYEIELTEEEYTAIQDAASKYTEWQTFLRNKLEGRIE